MKEGRGSKEYPSTGARIVEHPGADTTIEKGVGSRTRPSARRSARHDYERPHLPALLETTREFGTS